MLKIQTRTIDYIIYFLYFFSYIINPTGLFINLKMPALLLVILWGVYSKKKINFISILMICLVYFFISFSATNMLLSFYYYDNLYFVKTFITYLNLLPLLFIPVYTEDLKKIFLSCCNILSIVSIIISVIVLCFPVIALFLDNDPWDTIFIIQKRPILGIHVNMIYHLSSSILSIGLGFVFSRFLQLKIKRDFLISILYCVTIFFSGARANMLAAILIIFFDVIYYFYRIKKHAYFAAFLCVLGFAFAIIIAILLLTDKESGSNDIKYKHLLSYIKLFEENPKLFFFGNGPGSWFYTTGFMEYTQITELSYCDVIRNFGIFGGFFVIFLFFLPLIYLSKLKNLNEFSLFLSYLGYLFIAGTNPLLVVPQGFLILFLLYSFTFSKEHEYNDNKMHKNISIKKFLCLDYFVKVK